MYVTKETFEKMREELQRMKSIDRPASSRAIAEAREKGDLKDGPLTVYEVKAGEWQAVETITTATPAAVAAAADAGTTSSAPAARSAPTVPAAPPAVPGTGAAPAAKPAASGPSAAPTTSTK